VKIKEIRKGGLMKYNLIFAIYIASTVACTKNGQSTTEENVTESNVTVGAISGETEAGSAPARDNLSDFSGEVSSEELSILLTNSDLACNDQDILRFDGTNWACATESASPWGIAGSNIGYVGGNVGIGVSNASAKLEIGGTAGVDGVLFPDGSLQTSASQHVFKIKTNDESRANTTSRTPDSDLFLTLGTNETWEFEIELRVRIADGNPDFSMNFSIPADEDYFYASAYSLNNSMGGFKNGYKWEDPFEFVAFDITYTGTVDTLIKINGTIKTTTSAGTLAINWAQDNSDATPTIVEEGSFLKARRVFN